ncbi:BCCT family transporter, partial [Hydrogenophaga sp.]
MQLIVSAGLILAIVLWGVIAPASLGGVFDTLLAVITRDFGWLYLWVVLGLV